MRDHLRVLWQCVIASWAEFTAFYTWKTWTFAWLSRLLIQVCFYALLGQVTGDVGYLLIGNAVAITAIDATVVILLTIRERRSGTLALMVAAPSTHLNVYLGRGLIHLGSGVVASTAAFLLLPWIFGVWLPWPEAALVPLLIAFIGGSCYCYGLSIAALVLGFPSARWLALNLSYTVLMTFCGVNVPIAFWPEWLRALTAVLPLTHGLAAVRALVGGGAVSIVVVELALEIVVGAGWLALAALGFGRMVRHGRRAGTIEFSA